MTEKPNELDEQRKRNAVAMEQRVARIAARMADPKYPMKPDNVLLNATDEETRAYIRKRREEFMAKGGKWEQYQAEKAEQAKQQTVEKGKR